MKKKFFISLNSKIFLTLFASFAAVSSVFLSFFLVTYVDQMNRETNLNRKKAESLYEMYEENMALRSLIFNGDEEVDPVKAFKHRLEMLNKLKSTDERALSIRKELLLDMRGAKERDQKIKLILYFTVTAFLFVFFMLEILWLVMRRWVLQPIEVLLEGTHRISEGELSFRVPVSPKVSRQDELDLLSRDFNTMADSIKQAFDKTKENEQFLQNLINTIPDGLRVLDQDYNVLLTNSAYDQIYQAESSRSGGKCYELYGLSEPCKTGETPCPLALLKESGARTVNVIQKYVGKDGVEGYMDVSAASSSMKQNGKEYLRIIELIRPLKKAVLFSHQQKLSAVGMLASSVAHEMRNPLGSVRLILENIVDKMENKPMNAVDLKHYLQLVNEQIGFCIGVTTRLLKLARKPEATAADVDVNEIVSETVCLLEYEAKKRGIEISIKESDSPAIIRASDAEMRMVSVNLMQNALKAMETGGKLDVRIWIDGEKVKISFKDTGCGINPEDLPRIFEPFYSKGAGHSSYGEEQKGTGLGLSIVKTIVETYKGKIIVSSRSGEGTEFVLTFDRIVKNV